MTDESLTGKTVKVCHKKARIVEAHDRSYTAEIELGGVHQHIVLTESYVEDRVEA